MANEVGKSQWGDSQSLLDPLLVVTWSMNSKPFRGAVEHKAIKRVCTVFSYVSSVQKYAALVYMVFL